MVKPCLLDALPGTGALVSLWQVPGGQTTLTVWIVLVVRTHILF